MSTFIDKRQALKSFNLSNTTLKKYRLEGIWIEGIHWVRINQRCVRYNLELIQDWLHNCQDPIAHQRTIQLYQANLLSNQRKQNQTKSRA